MSVDQPHLPGTDHAKVKFIGLSWETLEVPDLLEEVELIVVGTVVAHGEEVVKDGVRKVAKVKVTAVRPPDE